VEFPQIGVLPYMLTLAGHGFYWFELSRPQEPSDELDWETEGSSAVADSLLAAGVVHAADEQTADDTTEEDR
jgi:maltose alpha-D-glucosyltransferase/alpha-amylase